MKPEQWSQIEPLYHAALERAPDATKKGSFLFLSIATGQTWTVVVADYPIGGMIGLSPDQRFLGFALTGQLDRDLMLIENFVVR